MYESFHLISILIIYKLNNIVAHDINMKNLIKIVSFVLYFLQPIEKYYIPKLIQSFSSIHVFAKEIFANKYKQEESYKETIHFWLV